MCECAICTGDKSIDYTCYCDTCIKGGDQMSCNHSQDGVYIACIHCDIEHAVSAERERIIQLLYRWDSLTVFDASDPEDDLKILSEMRRAYQVGYEQSWSDNK